LGGGAFQDAAAQVKRQRESIFRTAVQTTRAKPFLVSSKRYVSLHSADDLSESRHGSKLFEKGAIL